MKQYKVSMCCIRVSICASIRISFPGDFSIYNFFFVGGGSQFTTPPEPLCMCTCVQDCCTVFMCMC